jgi:hypothetical protein
MPIDGIRRLCAGLVGCFRRRNLLISAIGCHLAMNSDSEGREIEEKYHGRSVPDILFFGDIVPVLDL